MPGWNEKPNNTRFGSDFLPTVLQVGDQHIEVYPGFEGLLIAARSDVAGNLVHLAPVISRFCCKMAIVQGLGHLFAMTFSGSYLPLT